MREQFQTHSPSLKHRLQAALLGAIHLPLAPLAVLTRIPALQRLNHTVRYYRDLLAFRGRSDDIFIVTYPKSGTTWLQMLLYQVTTNGDLTFNHISDVSPWLESVFLLNEPGFYSLPAPRLIKSHLAYRHIPKMPCKYIYVAREGRDVAVSYYHQHKNYPGYQESFPTFFARFMKGDVRYGSWFQHVHDWWHNKDHLDVLFLTFEELKRDPETVIRRIAEFCGSTLDKAQLARVLERSSFDFMSQHQDKFGPRLKGPGGEVREMPKNEEFIREGKTGGWASYFDQNMLEVYRSEFRKRLGQTDFPISEPLESLPTRSDQDT